MSYQLLRQGVLTLLWKHQCLADPRLLPIGIHTI